MKIKKIKFNIKQASPNKYSDSHGLQLHVFQSRKTWIYAYRYQKKQRSLTLGRYPDVSLADARLKRNEAQKLLREGIDPNKIKKEQNIDENKLFKKLAIEWLDNKKHTISNDAYKRDLRAFEKDFFPYIGDMDIKDIKGIHVLECAKKIEARGALELAKRAIPLAGRVFQYAISKGLISGNPALHLNAALKPRVVQNMPRIDARELPALLKAIDGYRGSLLVKLAMLFMNLTFVRTKELRFMEWSEINYENRIWRIPAEKMKKKFTHIVPLSDQSLEILSQLKNITGNQKYVFYNHSTAKPLSENAITSAFHKMGYKGKMTGHGFRGLNRTGFVGDSVF